MEAGHASLSNMYAMVSNTLAHMTKTDLLEQHVALFKFFLQGFDYRRHHQDNIKQVETDAIQSFLGMVVKLNETLFRPLFLKLVDWATFPQIGSELTAQELSGRSELFYNLLDQLLDRLKVSEWNTSYLVYFCSLLWLHLGSCINRVGRGCSST
jgi:U3 small nucleolar RNA-associated protein 10